MADAVAAAAAAAAVATALSGAGHGLAMSALFFAGGRERFRAAWSTRFCTYERAGRVGTAVKPGAAFWGPHCGSWEASLEWQEWRQATLETVIGVGGWHSGTCPSSSDRGEQTAATLLLAAKDFRGACVSVLYVAHGRVGVHVRPLRAI